MGLNQFIKRHKVRFVKVEILDGPPYLLPKEEWPKGHRYMLVHMDFNDQRIKIPAWAKFMGQVSGKRGLINLFRSVAYDLQNVAGLNYHGWLKIHDFADDPVNMGIYNTIQLIGLSLGIARKELENMEIKWQTEVN